MYSLADYVRGAIYRVARSYVMPYCLHLTGSATVNMTCDMSTLCNSSGPIHYCKYTSYRNRAILKSFLNIVVASQDVVIEILAYSVLAYKAIPLFSVILY